MQMLYNSDNFVVVQFDVPAERNVDPAEDAGVAGGTGLRRGGYEIVDKFARKEIFIEGAMAAQFKQGVDALIETRGTQEDMDDFIARYSCLMQQPLVLH